MCLDILYKRKRPEEIIAYKVFRKTGDPNLLEGAWIPEYLYEPKRYYIDKNKGHIHSVGPDGNHRVYYKGYHAYARKKDAKEVAACGRYRGIRYKAVRKVRLSKITAIGKQDGYPCVVGREMYIYSR